MGALKRWIEPSSRQMATTPRQRPSSSMIRSMAKYSMKNCAEWRSAWPYMVCSIAWPVRSAAAQVRCAFPVMRGHAAERTLIDLALLGTRERHAPMLELVHRGGRIAAHVFDRVLVTEPVR